MVGSVICVDTGTTISQITSRILTLISTLAPSTALRVVQRWLRSKKVEVHRDDRVVAAYPLP